MSVLAFDIGGTAIKIGVFNDENELVFTQDKPTNAHLGGAVLLNQIIDIAKKLYKQFGFEKIGISCAGQVDSTKGMVTYATDNIPGWGGTCIKEKIEKALPVKVFVENDVNAAALGEMKFGAATDEKDFICLTYGTGIGGAIIQNNEIVKGVRGAAGEFGHIITHWQGKDCTCGQKGCYEAYASVSAFLKMFKDRTALTVNGKEIFAMLEQQNENSEIINEVVDEWTDEIAAGLVSLIHIFNPSLIVLGGGIMQQKMVVNLVTEKVYQYIISSFKDVKIKAAQLDGLSGLYGALYIAQKYAKE